MPTLEMRVLEKRRPLRNAEFFLLPSAQRCENEEKVVRRDRSSVKGDEHDAACEGFDRSKSSECLMYEACICIFIHS